jgi:hypothetical protein
MIRYPANISAAPGKPATAGDMSYFAGPADEAVSDPVRKRGALAGA